MFSGTFYRCEVDGDVYVARSIDSIDTKQDCLDQGYDWVNADSNFDTISNSLLTIL